MQTIDLPVEQAAEVVKRHFITTKHHYQLPGGSISDSIYTWVAKVERAHQHRRTRAQSISLPAIHEPSIDPLLTALREPGGFRRAFVMTKAAQQGRDIPKFLTSNFVEFLCLFGHFGGEDLSDSSENSDETTSDEDQESDEEEGEDEGQEEEEEGEWVGGSSEGSIDQRLLMSRRIRPLVDRQALPSIASTSQPLVTKHLSSAHPWKKEHVPNSTERRQSYTIPAATYPSSHTPTPRYPHHLRSRERTPLLPKVRPTTSIQGKATPGKAMFLLLKSFVTTGIMFLPKAFSNGGLLFSIMGVITLALVSLWSFLLLVQTRQVVPASFGDMGGVLFGHKMRTAVLLAITLSQIGFVCAYMVFVAENIQALVLTYSDCRLVLPMHLLILAQSFAFIPLAMIRRIQRLSVFALTGDVFIVIGLAYLFFYDFKALIFTGVEDVQWVWNPMHFPLFIGTAVFTFEGVVIPIIESMKEPEKFPRVLTRALALITLLFISMGSLSYMAFGNRVQTIILLNLPSHDPVVATIQGLYSLAICLSIPLQLFPAIRIMENGLFVTRSGKNNAMVKWQKNVFRVLVVFLCAWIAIVGSKDKLDKFVSLIGALFCLPLCFVFPPLFHLKAFELSFLRRMADYLLICLGIGCMVFVSFMTLSQWNSAEVHDPVKHCVANKV
ncbi:hypothetical protein PHYBLDRAFT_153121 [Phycomyces blakesleeanus NRRL 1555(-)]|uniref:Amino acid transporter transmembrane domain-containing protein n=1 Tax=Phycomyces blakesleeanus (strain ATCC 8743b / DSM 1359 / FGSC 10004 / NBRC 33097 / NRRL 1555) TaxID=763407 RepID=A0A167JF35_PHYB8|nr:hypothetical protein PHYBLDRAFT_153121 [Phycomyces blakesleeanus NRRL 1555(-)]OAD65868.1 hypothetical protein PHYBLDRAFT_153121 [Phycomyces blakesleeanus NRRL 1555(-)]|eukprot:XP_018283908.1 hypothetical protein PHYBLDRAFT_153121 [Phycomyces blakesleeanus NRRL 1555(-)]